MSDETAGSCRLQPPPPAAPLDSDDLLGEILLRLPPLPSSLPRVAAVSKLWGSLATSAAFHCRFRSHRRKLNPPILGVFHWYPRDITFTSLLSPPDRIPAERFSLRICGDDSSDAWSMLGCRHGRVLVINRSRPEVLVFHPVSGDRRIVDVPPEFDVSGFNVHGAVFCSAGDDDQDNAFKVVLVGTRSDEDGDAAIARVYSSVTGMWGDPVSTAEPCGGFFGYLPCTLIGNAFYWWLKGYQFEAILEFNLDSQSLSVIRGLPIQDIARGCMRIIRAEDGGVGVGILSYPSFHMWDLKVDCQGVAAWVLQKTVNMQEIIGLLSIDVSMVYIAAYAEDADMIFIRGCEYGVLISVQLESMKVKKYPGTFTGYCIIHSRTSLLLLMRSRVLTYDIRCFTGTVRACSTTPAFDPQQPSSNGSRVV